MPFLPAYGVIDGAFLAPGDGAEGPVERMVAIVVAPGLSAEDIRSALREKLDSAFIPRRVLHADALPRNAAGKLPQNEFRRFAHAALPRIVAAERVVRFDAGGTRFQDHFPGNPMVPGAVPLGEANDFFADRMAALPGPVELVSARFPDSAVPGEDCLFRMQRGADHQYRIECSQGGRVVMKAAMRVPDAMDE